MAIWTGWQADLLGRAGLPTAEATQEFLFDWHSHSASDCRNNPIDISHSASGATNCHKLTSTRTAKNYTSHSSAAGAFSAEIHSGQFPALLQALNSAIPYQQPSPAAVAADLRKWGSPAFATYYLSHSSTGSGGGQGGGGVSGAANSLKGWGDIQKQVNRTMPTTLRRVGALQSATSTALRRRRRVRR